MSHATPTLPSFTDWVGSATAGVPASVRPSDPDRVETLGMGYFPDELGLSGPASDWLPAGPAGPGA